MCCEYRVEQSSEKLSIWNQAWEKILATSVTIYVTWGDLHNC